MQLHTFVIIIKSFKMIKISNSVTVHKGCVHKGLYSLFLNTQDKLNESYLGHRTLLCDAADWHQYDQDGWCCTKLLLLFSIWQQPAPPQCWLGTAGTSGGTDSLWKASWRRLWEKTECKHEVNYISNTKPVTELVTLKVLTSDEWRLHIFKWSNNK